MSSSIPSLTSALEDGVWLRPRSGRFTLKKGPWYPLYIRVGGPHGLSGQERKQ